MTLPVYTRSMIAAARIRTGDGLQKKRQQSSPEGVLREKLLGLSHPAIWPRPAWRADADAIGAVAMIVASGTVCEKG